MQAKFLGYSLIALFTVWAVCAALGVLGQRKLFYEEGGEELYDYWMPRMCWEQGYVGHPEKYAGLTFAKDGRPVEIDDIDVLWSGTRMARKRGSSQDGGIGCIRCLGFCRSSRFRRPDLEDICGLHSRESCSLPSYV